MLTSEDMKVWQDDAEYQQYSKVKAMNNTQILREFHETYGLKVDQDWAKNPELEQLRTKLIAEEFAEFMDENDNLPNLLKELADIVYTCYGYAVSFGWDLDEAMRRVHISNMSKLDENGNPIYREDGKIIKGPNYKEPEMKDLV